MDVVVALFVGSFNNTWAGFHDQGFTLSVNPNSCSPNDSLCCSYN